MKDYSREETPSKLISSLRRGDEHAAYALHDRYAQRLMVLVRGRMNPAFQRRMDPEDVVQSAFRSFFRVVTEQNRNEHRQAEKVWSLLAAITINKLNERMRFHLAGKRSVNQEECHADITLDHSLPETETIFVDELEWVLRNNTERHRQILEMLLSGQDESSVAQANQCTMRTVYRVVERTVDQLQSRLTT